MMTSSQQWLAGALCDPLRISKLILCLSSASISGQETDKLWRKEGQKIASTNPRFVSRQVTHLPQVLSSAATTAALGTQAGLRSEPDLKKHTSTRVQNALKFIISQNPSSRSQSSTPVKAHPPRQPPTTTTTTTTPVKTNSASPSKPLDSVRKTTAAVAGKGSSQVESVGTQTAVDVRSVSTCTPHYPGDAKAAVKEERVKRKPSSKLESLLCDEPFSSPVKQETSKTVRPSSSPPAAAAAVKEATPTSPHKLAGLSFQTAANPVPAKPLESVVSTDPVDIPQGSSTNTKPGTAESAKQSTSIDADTTVLENTPKTDVTPREEVPTKQSSSAPAGGGPPSPRLARKRPLSPSSPPPAPIKRALLSCPTPPLDTSAVSLPAAPPPDQPPMAATTVPLPHSPELKHKPPPVMDTANSLSEMNLDLLLKQAESPVSTPGLHSVPGSLQSPVLHTASTPSIIIEDQTESLIEAICSDMSTLEESVAISELADQLGLEPSQLTIPDFMHLIQPGIGTMESNPGVPRMETDPVIEKPNLDPSTTQTSQATLLPKPTSLPLAPSLPSSTPLLETIFTPCEDLATTILTPTAEDLATPLVASLLPDSGGMVDLDSLVGEGLEGIPQDIAETIQALVRLDEQSNAPWKQ